MKIFAINPPFSKSRYTLNMPLLSTHYFPGSSNFCCFENSPINNP